MIKKIITVLFFILPLSSLAGALNSEAIDTVSSTFSPTYGLLWSSDTTGASNPLKLIVKQAKNDAATFIASQGEQRGAYLQAALIELRKHAQLSHITDMELAKLILTL